MIATLPPPLRRAVSPVTGIVRSLDEALHLPTEPLLFRASCEVARSELLLGVPLDHLAGIGGAGLTRAEAAAAAVGEALERYCATYVPRDRIVTATARELGETAVAPERFALFSPRQHGLAGFPYEPFTPDTPVPWVQGWALPDGSPAWLPAELVYLVPAIAGDGARIGYATSSGMACAATVDDALVRGLCEVLERDAFMIVWANRLSLPLLDLRDDDELVDADRRLFAPTGLSYACIDLSPLHGLPSILGVVRAPRGYAGALGVGAGTAPTLFRAWWKALSEAFSSRAAGAKLALLVPDRRFAEEGCDVVCFEDHIRYYADHDRAAAASFLASSPRRTRAGAVPALEGSDEAERVAALCERVAAAGSSPYAVDVTAPDVRELGLVVTKVIAPELCALDVPHGARFLGGRRLYDAAAALGLRSRPLAEADVNPEPHPFP